MLRLSLICFIGISVLTPWDRRGMIFVSSARQVGGQLLNFKSLCGDIFRRGKMILGTHAGGEGGGGLLYHDELFVFPQNASP